MACRMLGAQPLLEPTLQNGGHFCLVLIWMAALAILATTYSDAFSWVMVIILLFKFHRNSVQQFQWPRGHHSAKCLVPNRWQTITWTKDQILLCKYVSTYFDVFKTIPPSLILCIPFSNPREIMNIPLRSADFSGREEAMAHFHLHRHAVPSLCIQVCPVGSSR